MAITQNQTWRIREAINKKIARQIEQGVTPLTIYKTFFPFEGDVDIIDRRTGFVKPFEAFVRESVKEKIGTQKQFVYQQSRRGVSKTAAAKAYQRKKAEIGRKVAGDYRERVQILSGMDIIETREAKEYQKLRIDEIVPSFLAAIRERYGADSPEFEKAVDIVTGKSDIELVRDIRKASKKSRPGRKGRQTVSFYKMLAEVMGVDDPGENTP